MKRYLCAALRGFLYGVALQYLAAAVLSLVLRLGYLMLYPAGLPEMASGEIQAVLLMALPCGLVGAAYACLLQAARHAGHLHRREAV